MSTLQTHLYDRHAERGMPDDVKNKFLKEGLKGTLCGYIRKTTTEKDGVTCKNCIRLMNKLET